MGPVCVLRFESVTRAHPVSQFQARFSKPRLLVCPIPQPRDSFRSRERPAFRLPLAGSCSSKVGRRFSLPEMVLHSSPTSPVSLQRPEKSAPSEAASQIQAGLGKKHCLPLECHLASPGRSRRKRRIPTLGGWIRRASGRLRPFFADSRSFLHHSHVKSPTVFAQRKDFLFRPAIG